MLPLLFHYRLYLSRPYHLTHRFSHSAPHTSLQIFDCALINLPAIPWGIESWNMYNNCVLNFSTVHNRAPEPRSLGPLHIADSLSFRTKHLKLTSMSGLSFRLEFIFLESRPRKMSRIFLCEFCLIIPSWDWGSLFRRSVVLRRSIRQFCTRVLPPPVLHVLNI